MVKTIPFLTASSNLRIAINLLEAFKIKVVRDLVRGAVLDVVSLPVVYHASTWTLLIIPHHFGKGVY